MDQSIVDLINQHSRFLIILSIADEDSLSSGIILKRILASKGKQVKAIHYAPIPERFHYIPYLNEIEIEHPTAVEYTQYDVVITVDAGSIKQLMEEKAAESFVFPETVETISIDHHSGNTRYAKHYVYDADASSTAELIYLYFIDSFGHYAFNPDEATLLLIGIIGDTGFFKWSMNTKILKITEDLLNAGADNFYITNYLYYNKDFRLHKFLTYSISKIEFFHTIRFMLLCLSESDVKDMGLDIEDAHQFTRPYHEMFTNAYKGYDYGGVLIEGKDMVIGSFRGNPYTNKVDLAKFCKNITQSGGGHFNSAGFSLPGANLAECKKQVVDLITKMYYNQEV